MTKRTTELTEDQWKAIEAVAASTHCLHHDKPSWTKLLKRIADGELKVVEVNEQPEPSTKPKLDVSKSPLSSDSKPANACFGPGWSSDAYL